MTEAPRNHEAGIKTDADLLDVLALQLARFADGPLILSAKEIDRLKKFTRLVEEDRATIKNHAIKKRAHIVLTDLSTKDPAAFFLCALGTVISRVGKLASDTYMGAITNWWRHDAVKWAGLIQTMDAFKENLPLTASTHTPISTSTAPTCYSVTMRLNDLRRVMDCIPDQDITVLLPGDGTLPFTQFGWGEWQIRQNFSWPLFEGVLEGIIGSTVSLAGDKPIGGPARNSTNLARL